jgi:hypothetical protein
MYLVSRIRLKRYVAELPQHRELVALGPRLRESAVDDAKDVDGLRVHGRPVAGNGIRVKRSGPEFVPRTSSFNGVSRCWSNCASVTAARVSSKTSSLGPM